MKLILKIVFPFLALMVIVVITAAFRQAQSAKPVSGAWQLKNSSTEHVLLIADNYFTCTSYTAAEKRYINSFGGTIQADDKTINTLIEFNSADNEQVGRKLRFTFKADGPELISNIRGKTERWTRVDDGTASLAGVWQITERMQDDGKLEPIHRSGTRKTIKILSGTRFQWVAIDPGKKEFSGTGGGTYTFENGKYTENIEFFSKDSSRVGASLSFDDKLENGKWHHSGLSSKGEKIYEVWSRIN